MPRPPRPRKRKLESPPVRRDDYSLDDEGMDSDKRQQVIDSDGLYGRIMPYGYNHSDTILGMFGLHCYNIDKGTNVEFRFINENIADDYYITLEAFDPASLSFITFQACVWFASWKNNTSLRLVTTICRIKPQVPGTTGEEDLLWDPNAVDDLCKGDMPNLLKDDAVRGSNKLQFYEVKETELQDNQWLYLYVEIALFSKWDFDLRPYLPFEMKKVVVQTREDIESSLKLKVTNAIFDMNFKACGGPQCRGIVRKTSDGKHGHMCLEAKSWIER